MQLIQPYVQKSRTTIRPRSSWIVSVRPPVLIQSSMSGNPGARTAGRDMELAMYLVERMCRATHRYIILA